MVQVQSVGRAKESIANFGQSEPRGGRDDPAESAGESDYSAGQSAGFIHKLIIDATTPIAPDRRTVRNWTGRSTPIFGERNSLR
jgi:hypothetical protein